MVKKSPAKKIILILLIVLLAGGLAFAGYWYFLKPKSTQESVELSDVDKQKAVQAETEKAKTDENKNSNQQSNGTQQQSTGQSSAVSVNISSAGQSGAIVYVNGIVSGATSGTCKLTMTKNSKKVEKSASIGFQVSYYICQGFNINSSEFSEKGDWESTIEATGPNGSGKSATRKVTVQ